MVRAAGSLGFCDLVAMRWDSPTMFIEVKGDKGSPYSHFGPARQRALIEAAENAGAEAWLAHLPPRAREPDWIPASKFPIARKAA